MSMKTYKSQQDETIYYMLDGLLTAQPLPTGDDFVKLDDTGRTVIFAEYDKSDVTRLIDIKNKLES